MKKVVGINELRAAREYRDFHVDLSKDIVYIHNKLTKKSDFRREYIKAFMKLQSK